MIELMRPDLLPPVSDGRRFDNRDGLTVEFGIQVVDLIRFARPITFYVDNDAAFAHPWELRCSWSAVAEGFEWSLEPGFVNAGDVTLRMNAAAAPIETIERIGSASGQLDAFLTERPAVPLAVEGMRKVGTDEVLFGDSLPELVPDFFIARGVRSATVDDDATDGVEVVQGVAGGDEFPVRLLRAVDVVLTKNRRSVQAVVVENADGGDDFTLGVYVPPGVDDPPFVDLRTKFEPSGSASFDDVILGGLADDPFDRLHIGTIWFLSPDGAVPGSDPDETWMPFVSHQVFWNLQYDTVQDLRPTLQFDRVPVLLPLAGGVGQPLAQFFSDQVTDAANDALQLLNKSRITGRFWTL